MKRSIVLFALMAVTLVSMAQRKVTGTVYDSDNNEPLAATTVKLLKTDDTLVKGVVTDAEGGFTLQAPSTGKYKIQITCVGFKPYTKEINVKKGEDVKLGNVILSPDAVMLKETTIQGNAGKVTMKADTFVYNAAAYRTPEGSVVEELVKRIPGAQVDDQGNVTINGKSVKKIKLDGKEFMAGDTKTAMKNLPTSIVETVRAYDDKSDMARISGIEDGEEETVLDFGIKKGMNKGFMSNNSIGVGTKHRYTARLFDMYTDEDWSFVPMFNANNTNDMGFGGGGGRFGFGRQGLQANKMAGLNVNFDNAKTLLVDASVRWNHSDGDSWSMQASENFMGLNKSFSNSLSQSYSRNNNWNANTRIEWKPDTMTNIMIRANGSLSSSDGLSWSKSATFNDDPYLYYENPLDSVLAATNKDFLPPSYWVNSRVNNSITYSDNKQLNASVQYNRKLNSNGRNITLRVQGNWSDQDSKNLSSNIVNLYQTQMWNALLGDSINNYSTNRYNLTPTKRYGYSLRAQYSEPIAKGTYIQLAYQFQYSHNESKRSTYDFSQPNNYFSSLNEYYINENGGYEFGGIGNSYRDWSTGLSTLPGTYSQYLVKDLSRESDYDNYNHTVELTFRKNTDKYQFNAGIQVLPQHNVFHQNYLGVDTTVVRNVVNWSPTARLRIKFSNQHTLRFDYRGNTQQPSMNNLMMITDDTDPLNISTGNPGLKPSFTQSFRLNYNNYIPNHTQSIMSFVNFQTTENSISQKTTYNPQTGGRYTRPENINGNWNVMGMVMYNRSLDTLGYFNVNTMTNISYSNMVSYYSDMRSMNDALKNSTHSLNLGERLGASYRNSWLEIELNGAFQYEKSENKLQPMSSRETWQFSYGGMVDVQLPWGTRINSSMNMNSRRGYSDATMNTNELIWNAQISQSFMKGYPLTVMLQFFDILGNQSNFTRSITDFSRTDTWYNSINSYAMLNVSYRFNVFGGKAARQQMGPMGGMMPMGGMPPMGGGNRGGNRRGGGTPPPMRGGFGGGF